MTKAYLEEKGVVFTKAGKKKGMKGERKGEKIGQDKQVCYPPGLFKLGSMKLGGTIAVNEEDEHQPIPRPELLRLPS